MVSRFTLICCAILAATSSVHAIPMGMRTSLEERTQPGQQPAPPSDEGPIESLSSFAEKISNVIDLTIFPEKTAQTSNVTTSTKSVKLTYYWLAYQPKTDTGDVELRSCNGKTLYGKASLSFAKKIRMEGSGHLANGKMLNLGGCNCADGTDTFNCFIDTKDKRAPFGYGVKNIPLTPFVSIANNDKERAVGTWLYSADFDGIKLPNGKVHNGCLLKADAIGRGGNTNHIDFFALSEGLYENTFSPKIKKSKIAVEWGSSKCDKSKVQGYGITPDTNLDSNPSDKTTTLPNQPTEVTAPETYPMYKTTPTLPEPTTEVTNPKMTVKLTYYWLTYQPSTDKGDVELRSCDGKTVYGKASLSFAQKIRMEGSGHLANGKMLNLGGCNCGDGTDTFNCFMDITNNKKAPFGYGVKNIPLVPFVSIANNDKERAVGTWLYAADFDGIKLPNGKVHNGCLLKADSIGRGGSTNHIDFFALTENLYEKTFDSKIRKSKISVEWGSSKCDKSKVQGYGTTSDMTYD